MQVFAPLIAFGDILDVCDQNFMYSVDFFKIGFDCKRFHENK